MITFKQMLDGLSEDWVVHLHSNGSRDWTLTIMNRKTERSFFYRGELDTITAKAWVGAPSD